MSRWTPETTDRLRQLWADGYSCSQIGARIGKSRNAVIGRVHRLRLPERTTTVRIKYSRRVQPKVPPKPKSKGKPFVFQTSPNMVRTPPMEPAPLPMPAADDVARVSFADLERPHCRWAVGDPAVIGTHAPLFCGLDRMPGSSYCPGHFARAHVPVRPRDLPIPAESKVIRLPKRETVAA